MSIQAIGGGIPYEVPKAAEKSQGNKELTTVTTQCKEEHMHDRSCPHTVTTRVAPESGENGDLLDAYA